MLWRLWVRCPNLAVYNFLINLWCSFYLPLYIFYAEEVWAFIFCPLSGTYGTINDKAVNIVYAVIILDIRDVKETVAIVYGP